MQKKTLIMNRIIMTRVFILKVNSEYRNTFFGEINVSNVWRSKCFQYFLINVSTRGTCGWEWFDDVHLHALLPLMHYLKPTQVLKNKKKVNKESKTLLNFHIVLNELHNTFCIVSSKFIHEGICSHEARPKSTPLLFYFW